MSSLSALQHCNHSSHKATGDLNRDQRAKGLSLLSHVVLFRLYLFYVRVWPGAPGLDRAALRAGRRGKPSSHLSSERRRAAASQNHGERGAGKTERAPALRDASCCSPLPPIRATRSHRERGAGKTGMASALREASRCRPSEPPGAAWGRWAGNTERAPAAGDAFSLRAGLCHQGLNSEHSE